MNNRFTWVWIFSQVLIWVNFSKVGEGTRKIICYRYWTWWYVKYCPRAIVCTTRGIKIKEMESHSRKTQNCYWLITLEMRLITSDRRFKRAVLKTYKIISGAWRMGCELSSSSAHQAKIRGMSKGTELAHTQAPCCTHGALSSAATSRSTGHRVGNPQKCSAWRTQPPHAAWFLTPSSKICMCWKHPCGDKILHLVTRSLIRCDYSHLMTDKSSENMTVLYETRNGIAFKHGTAWSDTDNTARQSLGSPQTLLWRGHSPLPVGMAAFHFTASLAILMFAGQQQGLQGPSPLNHFHSHQGLHYH